MSHGIRGLPSKKIFFLIVACLVGVGTVGFAVYATKKSDSGPLANDNDSKNSPKIESVENNLKQNSGEDDDNDGLLNWEESLWGTDPKKPDSDGDGTKDGEEARQNRNPAKAGPDDKLTATSFGAIGADSSGSTGANAGAEVELENTETAKISRELFENYLEAKRAGLPIDAETTNKIVNQAILEKSDSADAKQYTLADIKILANSTSSTNADFKKYGNDLGQALSIGASKSSVSEIQILQSAMVNENPGEIAKIDPIINSYSTMLNKLALISVPRELVSQHLDLLNGISRMLVDIKSFRQMFEDPMIGLVGVNNYYQDVELLGSAVENIKSFFDNKGIIFVKGEYGYIFTQTI